MKIKSLHSSKIPAAVKEKGCVALGGYAVFCGLIRAMEVCNFIHKCDQRKAIPAVGYVVATIDRKEKKIYYCRYGFINDNDIYEN